MEYQKTIKLLDKKLYQPSKSRTKNLVEINDEPSGTHNTNSQIKFKTSMLKSSLCDYSDAYKHVIGNPYSDCISEINNTEVDNAKEIDAVMPVYNLIECIDSYSKASGTLWQCHRDEPALKNTRCCY